MGRRFFPIVGPLNGCLAAGVGQPIRGAITRVGTVAEAEPFFHSPVAGDYEAAAPMLENAKLVGVGELLGSKAEEAHVVQDHQLWSKG